MNCRFEGHKQLMDEYSGKKGIHGMVVPRKGIGHAFRDTANTRHQNGPSCSRPGCSSRVNPPKVDQAGSSGKGKAVKSSFRSSSSGKEAVGSSSGTTNNPGKSLIEPQKTLSSWLETDSSETSSIQDELEISELIPSPENFTGGLQSEVENVESNKVMMMEIGSSSLVSKTRSQRNFHQKAELCSQGIKSTGPVTNAVTSRYGLRNLRCNSITDVVQASCSLSDSNLNRRKDIIKKRNCEGESSSNAKGKKMTGSSLEGWNSGSRNGISISDSRSRNITPHRDSGIASVRTWRLNSAHARGRLSSPVNENHITTLDIESPVMIPSSLHSVDLNAPGISYQNHTFSDTPLSRPSSYSRPGTSSEQFCGVMPVSPAEYGFSHPLINRDSFQHYNMDAIAEVIFHVNM